MTTDDDMREIEAALDEFQDASERVYEAGHSLLAGEAIRIQKEARATLLALIRQKLPQNDAEHERAVEAWHLRFREHTRHWNSEDGHSNWSGVGYEALRLMRARPVADKAALQRLREKVDAMASAEGIKLGEWRVLDRVLDWIDEESSRPAIEPYTFTGLPDTTYEKLVAKDKAAGELLRAAKAAVQSWPSGADEINALRDAIERAGGR